jgi:hypothetical protein
MNLKRGDAKYGPDPYRGRIDASGELVRGK